MKKVQIRLSEQSYEDLVRVADGVPLQRFLERMVDEAIVRATNPPSGTTLRAPAAEEMVPPSRYGDRPRSVLAERQERLNKGRAK